MRHLTILICLWSFFVYAQPQDHRLNFKNLDGTSFSFEKEQDVQFVLLWATWCTDCKKKLVDTLPEIQKKKGVSVVALTVDGDMDRVQQFVKTHSIKVPVVREADRELQKSLNVYAVPHWLVFKKTAKGKMWNLQAQGSGFDKKSVAKAFAQLGLTNIL